MKWKYRYLVLIIVSITYLLCYLDRMVMSTAIPFIANDFNLSPLAMGGVMSAFFASYSIMQVPGGLLSDKFGPKRVMFFAIFCYSIFTLLTGFANSLMALIIIRVLFGLGEGVYMPSLYKVIATWFPRREVGRANGFRIVVGSFGISLAPLFVAGLVISWGWRSVFYSLLVPGLILASIVWVYVKDSPKESKYVTEQELNDYDEVDEQAAEKKIALKKLFKMPFVMWCFAMLFFYDMAAWGFMSWLPTYLLKARGFSIAKMGIYAALPFLVGAIGTYLSGHFSDKYFSNRRQIPIIFGSLVGAFMIYLAAIASTGEQAVIYLTVGQFFNAIASAGILTIPIATLPSSVAGSAMGLVNTGGQIAGFLSPLFVGCVLNITGNNYMLMLFCFVAFYALSALTATQVSQKKAIKSLENVDGSEFHKITS